MALNITPRRRPATDDKTAEAPDTELEAAIAADKDTAEEKPSRRRTSTRTRSTSTTRASRAKKTDEESGSQDEKKDGEEKPRSTRRRSTTRSRSTRAEEPAPAEQPEEATEEAKSPRRNGRAAAKDDGDVRALLDRQAKELERQASVLEKQTKDIAELQKLQREVLDRLKGGATSQTAGRVGIFVDVANVELAIDKLNRRVNWSKVLKRLSRDRQLVCAVAYSPVHEDINVSMESQRFTEPFVNQGYRIVPKPLKKFSDGTVKANVDIEMTIEILEMLERLDVLCLVSGDGDFEPLVRTAQKKGVKVEVVSVGQATAMALKRASDQFIDLANILNEVGN